MDAKALPDVPHGGAIGRFLAMVSSLDKFRNFVHAFGAARVLIQRANKEGFLLEGMALYASLTDGFLRIGLVLKRQTVRKNSEIEDLLISQESRGQYFTERKIQRMALNERVIDNATFAELDELYDRRNDAIHKFFLTSMHYGDLPPVLERYELVYKKLYDIVYELEAEQIRMGVGMTGPTRTSPEGERAILEEIFEKIDVKKAP